MADWAYMALFSLLSLYVPPSSLPYTASKAGAFGTLQAAAEYGSLLVSSISKYRSLDHSPSSSLFAIRSPLSPCQWSIYWCCARNYDMCRRRGGKASPTWISPIYKSLWRFLHSHILISGTPSNGLDRCQNLVPWKRLIHSLPLLPGLKFMEEGLQSPSVQLGTTDKFLSPVI